MTLLLDPASGAAAAAVVLAGASTRPFLRARSVRSVANPPGRRPRRRLTVAIRTAPVVVLAVVGVLVVDIVLVAILVAAIATARRVRPLLDSRRARLAAHRQFPEAIERVVLLVHAGLSPHLAVREACRSVPRAVQPAFDAVVHRLDRGVPLGDALHGLVDVLGPRAASVADAFGAADRYGLPLEPVLDQLARDARAERRRLDEADARRLPVRLSFPLVTCTLPSFVLVAIAPAVIAALSSLGGTTW